MLYLIIHEIYYEYRDRICDDKVMLVGGLMLVEGGRGTLIILPLLIWLLQIHIP